MRNLVALLGLGIMAAAPALAAQDEGDPIAEVVGQAFPGSTVKSEKREAYNEVEMLTAGVDKKQKAVDPILAEGELATVVYELPDESTPLEGYRAYEKALTAAGYTEIYSCKNRDCGWMQRYLLNTARVDFWGEQGDQRYGSFERTRSGKRVLVDIYTTKRVMNEKRTENPLLLRVLSTDAVERTLEKVSAEDMAAAIDAEGAVAIYGLEFETGSATLLATSNEVVAEMATYLKNHPDVSVMLVGHTDNVGDLAFNMTLSKQRAASVRTALISDHGINAARLEGHGVGFLAPTASNGSEDGRARNRRVEMVKR
ncbi:MAG: DUF4892 domain-containing protein [Pseudomonadota bacterium]